MRNWSLATAMYLGEFDDALPLFGDLSSDYTKEFWHAKLAPYIDTSTRPWSFRSVEGVPLGNDVGTLPQFQRAAVIRETFFPAGASVPTMQLEFRPVEMDTSLREFLLDADGQKVRYDHGPQIPQTVRWPGPRGNGVVRVSALPAGATGMLNEGPWAMLRLFERVNLQPGPSSEKFRATFDIDGRRAVFELMTMSGPIRTILLRGGSSVEIKDTAKREGMKTLIEDGWRLVCEGVTTPAEVLRVSKDEGTDGFAVMA